MTLKRMKLRKIWWYIYAITELYRMPIRLVYKLVGHKLVQGEAWSYQKNHLDRKTHKFLDRFQIWFCMSISIKKSTYII